MRTRLEMMKGLALYLVLGVASATLGLLPWILTGMRLPLQNLWAADTAPDDMPLVLLPFSQYQLTLIVGLLVTGSTIAGAVTRLTRPRHPRLALLAVAVGTVGIQLTAALRTKNTVAGGLLDNSAAELYLTALLCGTLASIMIGLLVIVLTARGPVPGAIVAGSIAAVCFAPWLEGLFFPISSVTTASAVSLAVVRWAPTIILGVVMGLAGLKTVGRVLAAVFGLLILWAAPALFTAISVAAGSRILAYQPAEMAKYGGQVFLDMLLRNPSSLVTLVVAGVVAALVLGVKKTVKLAAQRSKVSRVSV